MKKTIAYLIAGIFILQACNTSYQTLVSPLESTSYHYHDIPLQSDSIKKATYISGAVSLGGSMAENDFFYSFQGSMHRSYNLGIIQGYVGADIAAGSYHFDQFNSYPYPGTTNVRVSPKFFGSYGLNSGVNIVLNFGSFEWRAIGIEGAAYNEFGEFLNYRKTVPDSNTSVRETNSLTKSLGGTTEFLWKKDGAQCLDTRLRLAGFLLMTKNLTALKIMKSRCMFPIPCI